MTRRRAWGRKLGWTLAATCVLALAGLAAWLENAQVKQTAGGVDVRLLLPLPRVGSIAVPLYADGAGQVRIAGFLDGPVVRRDTDGGWHAAWFCEDRVMRADGSGPALSFECAGRRYTLRIEQPALPVADGAMPAEITVVSDIEGNARFLDDTLRKLGIADGDGQWRYGKGHLVVLGDSVDRGREVFGVLWRLHQLALQAQDAGGAVHVLLGNHEQYALRGNFSRADPEHAYALERLGGYAAGYGHGTLLGDWLRAQPVMLKLGRTLFVHGGISPQLAAGPDDLPALNRRMRDYWRAPRAGAAEFEPVLGFTGLTQYRGMVMALDGKYPRATQADVDRAAARFGVDRIVVAHTQVPRVTSLYGGRVWAVNTGDADVHQQVLQFHAGEPVVVETGVSRSSDKPEGRVRAFSLSIARDRAVLAAAWRRMRQLSSLPHPY